MAHVGLRRQNTARVEPMPNSPAHSSHQRLHSLLHPKLRLHRPGHHGTHDSGSSHQADEDDDAHCVPLRKMHQVWDLRERWRGFVLFMIAGASWVTLQHLRVDAMFAYSTYRVYTLAEEDLATPFADIATSSSLVDFLENGVVTVMEAMAATGAGAVCPMCSVGLTPAPGDMFQLELADFICSDFDSKAGSSDYPRRECDAENALWASSPSVHSAPCCSNNMLALFSLLLMAEYATLGTEYATLARLEAVANNTVARNALFGEWTRLQISPGSVRGGSSETDHLIQIIVSRDGRMAGVSFKAAFIDQSWFPEVIKTWQEIWSQRYDDASWGLFVVFVLFTTVDGLHELMDVGYEFRYLYRTARRRHGFDELSMLRKRLLIAEVCFMQASRIFLLLIELPSILLPITLEILRFTGALSVINFNLCVSVTLAVMLARFFQEGQVIPAFELFVLTIFHSTGQLINFSFIMVITILVATEMHITIFGVYTPSYETTGEAFMQMFNHFATGKDFENTGGEFDNSPFGYTLLYVFGTLLLLLVLSQTFVAILVGAWQGAAELKAELKENASLPPGFQERADTQSLGARVLEAAVSCLTGYSLRAGAFGPQIKHALGHCADVIKQNLKHRRTQAEGFWAGEDEALTAEEETELFLFNNGLTPRHQLRLQLMETSLSEKTVNYLLGMYQGPEELSQHADDQHGVADTLRKKFHRQESTTNRLNLAEKGKQAATMPDIKEGGGDEAGGGKLSRDDLKEIATLIAAELAGMQQGSWGAKSPRNDTILGRASHALDTAEDKVEHTIHAVYHGVGGMAKDVSHALDSAADKLSDMFGMHHHEAATVVQKHVRGRQGRKAHEARKAHKG